MDGFCRGCLIKHDDPTELLQYTERNRRLFVYSTGLQVKRNDVFTFQICKDCYLNMKLACKFKKLCRTSDKHFKNYLALKNVGDTVDFCTFLKNSDETLTYRLPVFSGNSTPANRKKDDDNESTCTSIHSFITGIFDGEEVPDTEARIIREVIEEEADVLDDSLDSQWLQDDISIDNDLRLDFSLSAFSTPRAVNNEQCFTPKKYTETDLRDEEMHFYSTTTEKQNLVVKELTNVFKDQTHEDYGYSKVSESNDENEFTNVFKKPANINDKFRFALKDQINVKEICNYDMLPSLDEIDSIDKTISNSDLPTLSGIEENNCINDQNSCSAQENVSLELGKEINEDIINIVNVETTSPVKDNNCVIDKNLEEALKNQQNNEFSLDELLVSPPGHNTIAAVSTPTITNILFGEKLDSVESPINSQIDQNSERLLDDVEGDIEIFEEYFQNDTREFDVEEIVNKNKHKDIDINTDSKEPISLDNIEIEKFDSKSMNSIDIFNSCQKLMNDDSITDSNQQNAAGNVSMSQKINRELEKIISKKKSMNISTESMDIDINAVVGEKEGGIDDKKEHELDVKRENNVVEINILSDNYSDKFDYKQFYCHLCKRKFESSKALCMHFLKLHNIKIINPLFVSYKYRPRCCHKCGKEFRQVSNFHRHLKICQKQGEIFECSLCKIEFTSEKKFNIHMNVHIPKPTKKKKSQEKNFTCPDCGIYFNRKASYELHVKKHTKKYLISCEECGRGFYRTSDYVTHMKYHTSRFKCKLCSESFRNQELLTKHVKTHLRFDCNTCEKKFKKRFDLLKHVASKICWQTKGSYPEVKVIDVEKNDDVVFYMNGDDNTFKNKLPFLETEISN